MEWFSEHSYYLTRARACMILSKHREIDHWRPHSPTQARYHTIAICKLQLATIALLWGGRLYRAGKNMDKNLSWNIWTAGVESKKEDDEVLGGKQSSYAVTKKQSWKWAGMGGQEGSVAVSSWAVMAESKAFQLYGIFEAIMQIEKERRGLRRLARRHLLLIELQKSSNPAIPKKTTHRATQQSPRLSPCQHCHKTHLFS